MTRARFPRRAALAGTAAALTLATLLALPLLAQPGPGPHGGPPGGPPGAGGPAGGPQAVHGPGGCPLRALADFLDLTDAQVEEARLLLEDLAAELRPLPRRPGPCARSSPPSSTRPTPIRRRWASWCSKPTPSATP